MRFLLDECLSTRLAILLRNAGHDCVHARERDLLGAPDEQVIAAALSEARVLISMDTDFGELLAMSSAPLPSLILFRRVGRTAEQQAAVLLLNLDDIADDLEAGAIAVITNSNIRLAACHYLRRHLPERARLNGRMGSHAESALHRQDATITCNRITVVAAR